MYSATNMPSVAVLREMLMQINVDCVCNGESFVELTDVVFYAEQIGNMFECDYELALQLAQQVAAKN